ncbi:MAG: glycosyltransferase family 39 protein [Thermoleophilaceae bacterium]|nr:glycosyltransferase family 39 protein [Thermoleophilaceae bacterium]
MQRALPRLLLGLILVAGLALRLWNNDYGLPYVWSIDEGSHFANKAVEMFWQDLDPGYYENPAAYTYLLYGLLRVMYGPLGWLFDLPYGNVTAQFAKDPTQIWEVARTLAAFLCMLGVAVTYWAARRLWGVREGLVAAAVLAFAFLPVAYSRVAVTDVGALMGVGLALYGAVRSYEDGRLGHYALAGAGAGLAGAFKYTAGLALLPLAVAALARVRGDRLRAVGGVALGTGVAALVFLVLNPFVLGSFDAWWDDLRDQAEVASDQPKPGQEDGGIAYYLDSLTWGLGWALAVAALAGAVLELRRDLVRGLILIAIPIALFAYLSFQARYFGRWLLPAYPALAMLAAVALVRAVQAVPARRRGLALAGLTALALAQPVAADVRSALVLGREDTRIQARDWLEENYPPELRVAIEPAVPGRYYRSNPSGRLPAWMGRCPERDGWTEPGFTYTAEDGRRVCVRFKPGQFARPDGGVRASAYHLVLRPGVIDDLRRYGYCLVMTLDVVRQRALETGDPDVRAYYDRLDRDARVVREFSPYDPGAGPVPFSFDLSYNYYPTAYRRPGPTVRLYRLRDCRQRYGAPLIRIPKVRELPPFAPREQGVEGEET